MKFRTMKAADLRRTMAAQAQFHNINVEDIFCKASLDNFWVLIWTLLGCVVYGAEHRMLMEAYVLQDKSLAKEVLFRAFLKSAVTYRTSTLWKGFTSFTNEELIKHHHYYDYGSGFCTLLERAVLALKKQDDEALNEHLEALVQMVLVDDKFTVFNRDIKAHTWASYSKEYLNEPVEIESPWFEENYGDCSRWDGCYREYYPQALYIERDVYLQLEVGGLPTMSKIMERKLP